MKTRFFALLLLTAVALTGGVVTAQENTTSTTAGVSVDLGTDPCATAERIDNHTLLCSASINSENRVELVFRSTRLYQQILISDSGAFRRGGTVPIKEVALNEGVTRVEWTVTEYKGFTGVGISTSNALYSKPLKRQKSLLPGTASNSDIMLGVITVFLLFAVSLPACHWGIRKLRGGVHVEL